jgi:hypothetical protein
VQNKLATVQRHWRWLRADGVRGYAEEHDLNLAVRVPRDARKFVWTRVHGQIGHGVPVFMVGAQRSGTNMMMHGLDMAPEVRVYNEGNGRAFNRYRLKSLSVVEKLVARSPSRVVAFKPLCDSHRIHQILDGLQSIEHPRAFWIWRTVEGRVRSAVAKFPASNLQVLQRWASGVDRQHWQLQGISDESRAFLDSLDTAALSPESAAAAFWYVRNQLFFERHLNQRPDVLPISYDLFLKEPVRWMQLIAEFAGLTYRPDLIAHVKPSLSSRHRRARVPIDGEILDRCKQLERRLEDATIQHCQPSG